MRLIPTNETRTMQNEIKINDRVRSFDFPSFPGGMDVEGPDACFLEGVMVGFTKPHDCMYDIRVTRKVFNGEDKEFPEGCRVLVTVNGTGVVKIEAA